MGSPMIENSDRGITFNKQLAWTMLAALVAVVWYGGTTISGLQNSVENLVILSGETRVSASGLESRIRALEVTSTRQDARFDALSRSLEEVKSAQRESNDLLRQIIAAESK